MIYVVIGFLAVLFAALGGVLYAKGRDYSDMRNALQALANTVEKQDAEIKTLRVELSDVSLGVSNLNVTSDLKSRILALERKQTDNSKPQVVRGINQARRMAEQMGGVTGVKIQ